MKFLDSLGVVGLLAIAFVDEAYGESLLRAGSVARAYDSDRSLTAACPWPSDDELKKLYDGVFVSGFAMEFRDADRIPKINYVEIMQDNNRACTVSLNKAGTINFEFLAKQYKDKNCFQPGDKYYLRMMAEGQTCPIVFSYSLNVNTDVNEETNLYTMDTRMDGGLDVHRINKPTAARIARFARSGAYQLTRYHFGQQLTIKTLDSSKNPTERFEAYKYYIYGGENCGFYLDALNRPGDSVDYTSLSISWNQLKALKPGCFDNWEQIYIVAYSQNRGEPILIPIEITALTHERSIDVYQKRQGNEFKFDAANVGCGEDPFPEEIKERQTGFAMYFEGIGYDYETRLPVDRVTLWQSPECIHVVNGGGGLNMELLAKQYKTRNCFQPGQKFYARALLVGETCETMSSRQYTVNLSHQLGATHFRIFSALPVDDSVNDIDSIDVYFSDIESALMLAEGNIENTYYFDGRIDGFTLDPPTVESTRIGAYKYLLYRSEECNHFVTAMARRNEQDISIWSLALDVKSLPPCFGEGNAFNLVMFSETSVIPEVALFKLSIEKGANNFIFDAERSTDPDLFFYESKIIFTKR